MELTARKKLILNLLLEKGSISVADLSRNLAVSEVTIRSDLKTLEDRGLLSRVHGGAVSSIHPHIMERQNLRLEEKQNIARAAAALVQNGDTIMIEAGTTTALVCRYLSGKRDIHIVTNSVLAFTAAKNNPSLRITLSGGEWRSSTESFVGSVAVDTIRRFNVRFAFVGADGFDAKHGVTTDLLEGGEIIKVMKERAVRTILLADSEKFNRSGPVTIMPLSQVDGIITDARIRDNAEEELKEDIHILKIETERDSAVVRYWFHSDSKRSV
ncbi:MAG: DeoR/GlpR family DNA-binding transcription regulator [Treponema sp.]|jgi:DeoR family galactitol utilization operon repressor|nr:DeoR/GlpR family DNA-binding transcription regulator [Treponema sp.]